MIKKRSMCVVVSFILIILMLPVCGNVDVKAAKLKLNYSYYKMTGGYTVKLKTRSGVKAKWKSTNTKCASACLIAKTSQYSRHSGSPCATNC